MDRDEKLKLLEDLGGISEEDFDDLYLSASREIENELSKLKASVSSKDADGIRRAAHAIKGISANYRMKGVNASSRLMEKAFGEKNDWNIINDYIIKLEKEIDRLRKD